LILRGKEGGVDLGVAGGYKGAFEHIIISVRVYGGDRVGTKEYRFQFGVLRIPAYSRMANLA